MRKKINWWLWNDTPDWFADHFGYQIESVLCFFYGHNPIPDQCGMPEHDLCVFCNKLMPFSYIRYNKDGTRVIR